jgi:transposase
VAEEYTSGKISLVELMEKYAIRANKQIRDWVKIYNNRGDFKEIVEGGSTTVKARPTTQEERLKIVQDCMEQGMSYSEAAVKYQVSYQQVRNWVRRFREKGEAGLEDRRGQRKKDQTPRTREEELEQRIAQLEHEKYLLEAENWLLKKVKELERGDVSHK